MCGRVSRSKRWCPNRRWCIKGNLRVPRIRRRCSKSRSAELLESGTRQGRGGSEGGEDCFHPARHSEFFEHPEQVILNSVLADAQGRGDFLVAEALGQQHEDFLFALA